MGSIVENPSLPGRSARLRSLPSSRVALTFSRCWNCRPMWSRAYPRVYGQSLMHRLAASSRPHPPHLLQLVLEAGTCLKTFNRHAELPHTARRWYLSVVTLINTRQALARGTHADPCRERVGRRCRSGHRVCGTPASDATCASQRCLFANCDLNHSTSASLSVIVGVTAGLRVFVAGRAKVYHLSQTC
jgi:hypothetical protein